MALTITFTPKGLTASKYDEVIRRLEGAGSGAPRGRIFHTCFGSGDQLRVVEVWNSEADFGAFGATLIPILGSLGIDIGTPDVQPQHNSIAS